MEEKIKKTIESIRPALQRDGGDISFVSYQDGVCKVKLSGACKGCPMSQYTVKAVVESAIKKEVPEVEKVEAV